MQRKILVVEDEVLIAENLLELVEEFGYRQGPLTRSYEEAALQLNAFKPDLVVLDINLAGDKGGLELADKIDKEFGIPYIFLTSYNDAESVNEISKTNASAYLNKPFNAVELKVALSLALNKGEPKSMESDYLLLNTGGELEKVRKTDICYIKSDNVYLDILLVDNKRMVVRSTFNEIQKKLDEKFIRIHRSYVINLDEVDSVGNTTVCINNIELPVGRKYSKFLRDQLTLFGLK